MLPFNAFGTMAIAREEFDANSGSSQFFWLLKVRGHPAPGRAGEGGAARRRSPALGHKRWQPKLSTVAGLPCCPSPPPPAQRLPPISPSTLHTHPPPAGV